MPFRTRGTVFGEENYIRRVPLSCDQWPLVSYKSTVQASCRRHGNGQTHARPPHEAARRSTLGVGRGRGPSRVGSQIPSCRLNPFVEYLSYFLSSIQWVSVVV